MRIRRTLAVAATSLAMSAAVLAATPSTADAAAPAAQIDRCWETSWITGWWTGIAGHCVFDGVVYWYDFNGGYGVGWAV